MEKPALVAETGGSLLPGRDSHRWFYEGRNGWWQYDERTSAELEAASAKQESRCEVLIAGFLYIVDFEHMVQVRRNDLSRRRRIKRDVASIPKKGIAGIRLEEEPQSEVAATQSCRRQGETASTALELSTDSSWVTQVVEGVQALSVDSSLQDSHCVGSQDDHSQETNASCSRKSTGNGASWQESALGYRKYYEDGL